MRKISSLAVVFLCFGILPLRAGADVLANLGRINERMHATTAGRSLYRVSMNPTGVILDSTIRSRRGYIGGGSDSFGWRAFEGGSGLALAASGGLFFYGLMGDPLFKSRRVAFSGTRFYPAVAYAIGASIGASHAHGFVRNHLGPWQSVVVSALSGGLLGMGYALQFREGFGMMGLRYATAGGLIASGTAEILRRVRN
ncbi:MAG: hypothetical protein HY401_02980 [Elusimicrobia bacterium]|nr:hypothetical protein [Elusimicrobiota bacterium]